VLLDTDRRDEPQCCGVVREDPERPAFGAWVSALTRSSGLFDQIFVQWLWGKLAKAQRSSLASETHLGDDVESTLELACDLVELCVNGGSIRLGEDRPDHHRDHPAVGLWDLDKHVPRCK